MRKIVVEMSRSELEESNYVRRLNWIESLKIVQLLRYDPKRYSGIFQVKLRSSLGLKDLIGTAGITNVTELSKEKDGSYLVYGEGRPYKRWMIIASIPGGYVYPPVELMPTKWRMTYVGAERSIKKFLAMLDKFGLHYRIAVATDAKFTASSFLSALTGKQREVLVRAYAQGFFDTPRRIGTRELGQSLNLGRSAVIGHLRKAQKRLLDEIIAD